MPDQGHALLALARLTPPIAKLPFLWPLGALAGARPETDP